MKYIINLIIMKYGHVYLSVKLILQEIMRFVTKITHISLYGVYMVIFEQVALSV